MKRTYIFLLLLTPSILFSCIKTRTSPGVASLNIINAINFSAPLVTNFSPPNPKGVSAGNFQYYSTANQIAFGNSWESGSYTGSTFLSVSQITDTTAALWSGNLNLAIGSIHTLFFCGDTTGVDTLFTIDLIPYYPPLDSVAGVRFVNLVKGSLPMSVNLQGNPPSQIEFSDLGYKQISAFKPYNANSLGPGIYNFEIHDQTSDSLLAIFSWGYTFQRNSTVYISGSSALGIAAYQANNY